MQQPNVNLSLEQTTEIICENIECNSNTFQQQFHIRKAGAIVSGLGKPALIPIPIFACSKCGTVNQEFLPKELK